MTIVEFIKALLLVILVMAMPVSMVGLLKWALGKNRRFIQDKERFY